MRIMGRPIFRLVSLFRPQFYPGNPRRSGEILAQLVLGDVNPPAGRVYVSIFHGKITFPDPSVLAQSDEARDLLWRESAVMVGIDVTRSKSPPERALELKN